MISTVIIGTGDWARSGLMPALLACPDVAVVACVSPDSSQLARFAGDFSIPRTYSDMQTSLGAEPEVGLLVVSTPDDQHVLALRAAIERGIPIFCEKPVANSAEDARDVADMALRRPVPATVGFSFRYSTALQRLRDELRTDVFGDLWLVELWEANPQFHPAIGRQLTWKGDPEHAAGGAIFEYGAHAVDLGCWLMGPVETVSAQFSRVIPGARLDDIAQLQLRYRSGVIGSLTASWVLAGGFPGISVRVHGSLGGAKVELGARPHIQERYARWDAHGHIVESIDVTDPLDRSTLVRRHLQDLIAVIGGEQSAFTDTLPTLAQAAHVQSILDTSLRAADGRLTVA